MTRWVAIDPGDVHVGFARGTVQAGCTAAREVTPEECLDTLEELFVENVVDTVIVERFALDPKRAGMQSGSEFLTSQLIGAIRLGLCRKYKIPLTMYYNNQHKRVQKLGWFVNMTRADHMKMPYWVPGPRGGSRNTHALDAWSLGTWFCYQHNTGG